MTLYDCCVYSCFYSMKMVCFVSSRTSRIVTCFFSLRENLCYEMDETSISMFEILEPGGSALGKYSI